MSPQPVPILLTSCHLFSTFPTSSHPCSTLPIFLNLFSIHLTCSQPLSTLPTPCQLFSTRLISSHLASVFSILSNSFHVNILFLNSPPPFLTRFQLWSRFLSASPFFSPLPTYTFLNSAELIPASSGLFSILLGFFNPSQLHVFG